MFRLGIAHGSVFTVTICVTLQPAPSEKVTSDTPGVSPVNIPEGSIVPTAIEPLLHAPGPDASLSNVVEPWHTLKMPVIAAGAEITFTGLVATQPVPLVPVDVNEIIAEPTVIPVAKPVVGMISAIEGALLLQVPVPVLVYGNVAPTHIVPGPTIAAGFAFTVNDLVTKQPVPGVNV